MIAVQSIAAAVIGQVLAGKNLDRVLEAVLAKESSLGAGERAAVHSISFDTLRNYGLLSSQLDTLLTAPLADAGVRHLLLVSLAQLQFSKASHHAIVDHAVSACEAMGYARAKPLVNAVLRNFLRTPDKFARERFKTDLARYDFPAWWIARLKSEQPEQWEQTLLSAREHPPMCLRVNGKRGSPDAYVAELAKQGHSARVLGGEAVLLERPLPVKDLPGFAEGRVSVQDRGAQLAADFLGVTKGMRVLDACAAPGGKTAHLLERANLDLLALDSDRRRIVRVEQNLERLGLKAIVKTADAARPVDWWDGKPFDRILLDAPCSGSGVTRRHPDIKWLRRESDLKNFARHQASLLAALWNCLADGGRLLYVTCSVFRAENQEVVDGFLRAQPRAVRVAIPIASTAPAASAAPAGAGSDDAAMFELEDGLLLPDDHHDGFYFALLEKAR